MPILAHAASAEDGSGFGMPGDQTGREVRMEPLGADGNAWVWIFRWEGDPKIPYNIAEANRQACINICVGYSRETYTGWGLYHTRYGLWTAAHETGDIRKIEVPCNTDCSQLQITATWIAGVPNAENYRNMVTAIQEEVLIALGFKKYPYRIEDVKKGDILLRPGHTGCVVEGWNGVTPQPVPKYVGRITKELVPVYKTAHSEAANLLPEHPYLGMDNLVDVCDETEGYFYIRTFSQIRKDEYCYGYVHNDTLVPRDKDPIKVGDKVRFKGGKLYISAGGGDSVDVPAFDAEVRLDMHETPGFKFPYYIWSQKYDGWCRLEDLERR